MGPGTRPVQTQLLKILNLRFKNVSKVKEELLKEAEGIIKGKVGEKDRKECEW